MSEPVAKVLNEARAEKRRVIAVGTTAVRTLETVHDAAGLFQAGRGESSLFIYPGYRFKAIDALITNFHLPDSTPLLLANAFYGGTPMTLSCSKTLMKKPSAKATDSILTATPCSSNDPFDYAQGLKTF